MTTKIYHIDYNKANLLYSKLFFDLKDIKLNIKYLVKKIK